MRPSTRLAVLAWLVGGCAPYAEQADDPAFTTVDPSNGESDRDTVGGSGGGCDPCDPMQSCPESQCEAGCGGGPRCGEGSTCIERACTPVTLVPLCASPLASTRRYWVELVDGAVSNGFSVTDIDADPRLDFIVDAGGELWWIAGAMPDPPVPLGLWTLSVAAPAPIGDFDGDGRADVVAYADGHIPLFGDGAGGFVPGPDVPELLEQSVRLAAVGDVDLDGTSEVAAYFTAYDEGDVTDSHDPIPYDECLLLAGTDGIGDALTYAGDPDHGAGAAVGIGALGQSTWPTVVCILESGTAWFGTPHAPDGLPRGLFFDLATPSSDLAFSTGPAGGELLVLGQIEGGTLVTTFTAQDDGEVVASRWWIEGAFDRIDARDADGDGDRDLAFGGWDGVRLLLEGSDPECVAPIDDRRVTDLAIADIEADGCPELAVTLSSGFEVLDLSLPGCS